jgi:hypothetical protein
LRYNHTPSARLTSKLPELTRKATPRFRNLRLNWTYCG